MSDHSSIETRIEEAVASRANDADPNEATAAPGSIDTGFGTAPATATVNPAPAFAPATVETGFGDPGGTTAPVQQDTPTVNMVADMGKDPDVDLDARVASLLANKSATNRNAVSAFMANVVPWPGSAQDPGYINLHYAGVGTTGRYISGWPYKDLQTLINRAAWVQTVPTKFQDVWYCLSQQSTASENKNGNPLAVRKAANATAVKAIWVDIDVGPSEPGKKPKYPDLPTALKAILHFIAVTKLPPPSAIVYSGGGIHIYWISKTSMTPQEWQPYAGGLKNLLLANNILADTGLTTDIARILRVPGTKNFKYNPPADVTIAPMSLIMYDFATALPMLPPLAGPVLNPTASAAAKPSLFAEGVDPKTFGPPHPAFAAFKDNLNEGIGPEEHLLKAEPIFQQCGFYREALLNAGANNDQPQWNLAILGTTFMEMGDDIAHRISSGHGSYSKDDTQTFFDRKMDERLDRGIGYPSCATIAGTGCQACKTCPLLGKVRSPLNIRPVVTARVNLAPEDAPQADPSFVDPFAEFVGPEFPLKILPPTLATFVNAEHRAMGADPAAIAMAALTTVAGAMHAETQVRVGDGWWEKPILWTSLIGQPSSMKSPILKKATEPLLRIDHGRSKFWNQQHKAWAQTPNHQTIPIPPRPARCVINDVTPEKAAEVLSRDPSGSFMVQDELAGWLGGFERYNAGQSHRAFYLTAWNGGPFLKDRVGKGKSDIDAEVHVGNLALCVLGGIQPDRLTKLGDLTSDGLLQRFLMVLMKPAKLFDPDYPVAAEEAAYEKLIKSINTLPARNYHFADEAFEVRDDVLGYLHKLEQVDGFPLSLIGAIGKLKGYFARICLVLHVVRTHDPLVSSQYPIDFKLADAFRGLDPTECLSAGANVNAAIPRETAEAAKKLLLEFLLPHMIGLYDVVVNGGQEREKLQSIANFILASDKDRLRPSDFTAGVRTLRGEPEQKIREWVGRFCGMDWLSAEESKPGVPAKAWQVASGLRGHFAERRKQVQAARAEMHAILKAGGSSRSR